MQIGLPVLYNKCGADWTVRGFISPQNVYTGYTQPLVPWLLGTLSTGVKGQLLEVNLSRVKNDWSHTSVRPV